MAILPILLNVVGATMMLLFAVKIVQQGIQSHAGPSMRRVFAGPRNMIKSALVGVLSAIILQSGTATTLLITSFSTSGAIAFAPGIAAILGADIGSALIVLFLTFPVDWLLPVFLASGGWMFLKASQEHINRIGQVVLGIGLILLSLHLLKDAFEPVRNSEFWPAMMVWLEGDIIVTFLLGALLTFLIHSSVASILMCITLVELGGVPLIVGITFVIGANLGSSLIPLWLTRGQAVSARRLVFAGFILRASGAVLALLLMAEFFPDIAELGLGDGQTIIFVHLGFNLLLLLWLPFHKLLEVILRKFFPDAKNLSDSIEFWIDESCLDFAETKTFAVALSNIRRETMRMSQLVSAMAKPVLGLYKVKTEQDIERIGHMDRALNDGLDGVRKYAAGLSFDPVGTREVQELQELVNIAIDIKAAGDIISSQLLVTAQQTREQRIKFSDEGWLELLAFNDKVMENMTLAFGALASRDQTLATMVVEAKSSIRKLERESRNRHFARLLSGVGSTFDSSDIHLSTLRSLKELNSKIAEIVYPMLSHHGLLLDNRLASN